MGPSPSPPAGVLISSDAPVKSERLGVLRAGKGDQISRDHGSLTPKGEVTLPNVFVDNTAKESRLGVPGSSRSIFPGLSDIKLFVPPLDTVCPSSLRLDDPWIPP